MDKVILGQGCFAEDSIGIMSPNNNQIIVGSTGTGKTMSIMLPTILNMKESSIIATYSKAGEARKLAGFLEKKGYRVLICDLVEPKKGNIAFDPLAEIHSYQDVDNLANSIFFPDRRSKLETDSYWNDRGVALLTALILAVLMTKEEATMADVVELFNRLKLTEEGRGISTSLDGLFEHIKAEVGFCSAVAMYSDYQHLPYSTAGCVRDTVAKVLRKMFPESIIELMRREERIDFEKLASERTALFLITSPVNVSLYHFANLMFGMGIKTLLEYAQRCKGLTLPVPVRLMFDDFACAAAISDFSKHIAIFRAAGLSAMILLQSESQLSSLYSKEEAENIINNCSSYVYFPGGMDIKTCENISKRLDLPLMDIMYASTGDVIVMQSGKKPVITKRYDVYHSPEYKEFQTAS